MKRAIDPSLNHFIKAIKESEEFVKYQKIKDELKDEPEKLISIHEYREKSFNIQNNTEGIDLFEEIDKIHKEYAVFRADPQIEAYLQAEISFCRMMQHISRNIVEHLDFELGFDYK